MSAGVRWRRVLPVMVGLVCLWAMSPLHAQPSGSDWRQPYTGAQATGQDILGLWVFDPADAGQDRSSQGHAYTLRGERTTTQADDHLGSMLTITDDEADTASGAAIADHDALSPQGAFSGELWVRPAQGMQRRPMTYLLDKKYYPYTRDHPRANRDYMLTLVGQAGQWTRALQLQLGFGKDSVAYSSSPIAFEPGRWTHLAFSYDGQGQAKLYVDGKLVHEQTHAGRAAIEPGPHPLVIGDRVGSNYHRFVGSIAQVRLMRGVVAFRDAQLSVELLPGRRVFQRLEQDAAIELALTNGTSQPLSRVTVHVAAPGVTARTVTVDALAVGERRVVALPVDTALAAGTYAMSVRVAGADQPVASPEPVEVTLVNRFTPGRMPLVMWGDAPIHAVKALGFTHRLVYLAELNDIWLQGKPVDPLPPAKLAERMGYLDQMLLEGQQGLAYLSTIHALRYRTTKDDSDAAEYRTLDAQGKTLPQTLDPNFPRVRDFARHTGQAVGRVFGRHPALDGALVHSEVRDKTRVSWHDMNRQAYRAATGRDYPDNLQGPRSTHHRTLADFPADRVVADDDPILTFYRWFWKDGDGWNPLHSAASEGFKSTARPGLWTFFDPAARAPSLHGSGGDVDYLSQWTYSYPDPLKVVLATDQLHAMAAGRPGQGVMTMTQGIWYRSQTAPMPAKDAAPDPRQTAWEKQFPDARYISISPDILRQSVWLMLAQPVQAVMFHGMGSMISPDVHGNPKSAYVFTNEKTTAAMRRAADELVHPLGPTLKLVTDKPSDIAYLESFTSQMFASRGNYGWGNGWSADAYLTLLWAQLQPRVIYEQTLLAKGLDGYKALVLADCDVLPRSVVQAIQQWQERGGIVIADERVTPAIQADILLPAYTRTRRAEADKAALQKLAADLRQELDAHYQRVVDASSPDVLVSHRRWGDAEYVFAVNDRRRFGDYVGRHGLVMEQGLPARATLTLHRPGGAVYDVLASRQVTPRDEAGLRRWPVELEPGDGRLFLVTPQAIANVTLAGPASAQAGQRVTWQVAVVDAQGKPVQAVLPVEVRLTDAAGHDAEFSGWYGAAGGELTLTLDMPSNAAAGPWTIAVRDLASGQRAQATWQVTAE